MEDHLSQMQLPNQNQPQRRTTRGSTGYLGVRKRNWGRYLAEIRNPYTKKRHWLGTFDTAEGAAIAYDLYSISFSGPEWARTNFVHYSGFSNSHASYSPPPPPPPSEELIVNDSLSSISFNGSEGARNNFHYLGFSNDRVSYSPPPPPPPSPESMEIYGDLDEKKDDESMTIAAILQTFGQSKDISSFYI